MRELANVSSEAGRGIEPALIDPMNYADDEDICKRVLREIVGILGQIRAQRSKIEDLWNRYYKVWAAKHEYRLYEGRSDLYFPIARKIIEQHTAGIKMQVFPSTDAFMVVPNDVGVDPMTGLPGAMDMQLQQLARNIGGLIKHDVVQSKMERWMDMFIRQALIYGTSVVKSFWRVSDTTNYRLRKQTLADGSGSVNMVQPESIMLYEGPTFKVVNLLDWYIHPLSCSDIDEARMIFEDCMVDWNFLRSMSECEIPVYSPNVVSKIKAKADSAKPGTAEAGGPSKASANKNVRLQSYGVTVDQIAEPEIHEWKLTEIYCKFDLYDDGHEIACKISVIGQDVVEVRQNPFFNQRPPYRALKIIDVPDMFYGQGLVESIEHHQYALNAMLNQTLDAVIFQTNHIIVVNTSLLAQAPETLRIAPRAVWKTMANPNDVVSIIRPPDNSASAFNTANMIAGSMQDTAGMPPVMMGKMPSSDSTATANTLAQQGASVAQNSIIRNVETSILSPLLHDWYSMEQQFRSTQNMLRISGMAPLNVDVNALTMDWQFTWLTSSQISPMVQQMNAASQAMQAGNTAGMGQGGGPGGPGPGPGGQQGGSMNVPQLGTVPSIGR